MAMGTQGCKLPPNGNITSSSHMPSTRCAAGKRLIPFLIANFPHQNVDSAQSDLLSHKEAFHLGPAPIIIGSFFVSWGYPQILITFLAFYRRSLLLCKHSNQWSSLVIKLKLMGTSLLVQLEHSSGCHQVRGWKRAAIAVGSDFVNISLKLNKVWSQSVNPANNVHFICLNLTVDIPFSRTSFEWPQGMTNGLRGLMAFEEKLKYRGLNSLTMYIAWRQNED